MKIDFPGSVSMSNIVLLTEMAMSERSVSSIYNIMYTI